MLKIGVTGGIGCGKTTVSKIFQHLKVPIYFADIEAKRIMNDNLELKNQLYLSFGKEIFNSQNIHFPYLASIVFNDEKKRQLLNELVHPFTLADFNEWCNSKTTKYIIKEAALLFESEAFHFLDYILGVYSPNPLRIKRIIKRNGFTADEIKKRMDAQLNENIKMKLCDDIIYNDEKHSLIEQVLKLHQQFINQAF